MPTLNEKLTDATYLYFTHLMQYTKGSSQAIRKLMDQLGRDLASQLALASKADGSGLDKGKIRELLDQVNRAIDGELGTLSAKFGEELPKISSLTSNFFVKSTNAILDVQMLTGGYSLSAGVSGASVFGKPLEEWWSKQAQELKDAFETQMRVGATRGESITQLMARIYGGTVQNGVQVPGIMGAATKRASALVRTGIMSISNGAREEAIKANADIVKGYQWVATLDKGTCDICGALDGKVWSLDDLTQTVDGEPIEMPGMPPAHPNCRCTVVPVLRSYREMGIDADEIPPGTRASMDGQIPETTSYEDWFAGKEAQFPGFAEAVLGKANASLWEEGGKQSLLKLLDQTSKPLAIEKLEGALENVVNNLASAITIKPATGNLPTAAQVAVGTRGHLNPLPAKEIESQIKSDFAKRGIDLTNEEVTGMHHAIRGYGGSYCGMMKKFQETGTVPVMPGEEALIAETEKRVRNLDRWLDNTPAWPSDKPLYRGLIGDAAFDSFEKIPVGGKVEIGSFASFTSDRDIAGQFAVMPRGGLMKGVEIEIVGGDYVAGSIKFASPMPDESEVVVKAGQYMRILSKRVDGNLLRVKARIERGRT